MHCPPRPCRPCRSAQDARCIDVTLSLLASSMRQIVASDIAIDAGDEDGIEVEPLGFGTLPRRFAPIRRGSSPNRSESTASRMHRAPFVGSKRYPSGRRGTRPPTELVTISWHRHPLGACGALSHAESLLDNGVLRSIESPRASMPTVSTARTRSQGRTARALATSISWHSSRRRFR